jgi:FkbM family methyltransferase
MLPANEDLDVNVLCTAVSDRQDIARFLVASRGRSSSSLETAGYRTQAAGTRYSQHVPTTTLDRLLAHFPKPDVVKIDVEGAERLVLDGAHDVLTAVRPRFYIEVGGAQNADVTSVFRKHEYRLYDGNSDDGVARNACGFNTLAVPAESQWTNATYA